MNAWYWAAMVMIVVLGAVHSVLGEWYILMRPFRRADLPTLFGSDDFTKRTLRLAFVGSRARHLSWMVFFAVTAALIAGVYAQ